MEERTSPRRGRQRKAVDDVKAVRQAESSPDIDTGDGQASESRASAQAEHRGSRPVVDWERLSLAVIAAYAVKPVSTMWYPEARGDLFELPNGVNVRVLKGDPAWQHSDGSIVAHSEQSSE